MVSYVKMNADKFKAKIGNTQIDLLEEINPEQYKLIENNPNVVRCIPLDDIDSFSLTAEPTEEEYKIFNENGFVSNGTDEYEHYCYIRQELLAQQ